MARSLELGGVKTGMFVSPHVSCFRERMLVNGKMIAEHEVEDILPQVRKNLSPVAKASTYMGGNLLPMSHFAM
ncbi:unnamed protein product [Laminaria digitata]